MSSGEDVGTTLRVANPVGRRQARRYVLVFEKERTRAADLPERGRLVIGRAPEADLVIDDASVSRRHAEIVVEGNDLLVRDLESRNGTRRNGDVVAGTASLRPGDVFHLGSVVLVLGDVASGSSDLLAPPEFEARLASRLGDAAGPLAVLLVRAGRGEVDPGAALRQALGAGTLVASYGGDHYHAATPVTANLDAAAATDLVRRALPGATVVGATFPRDAATVEELLAASRRARHPAGTRAHEPVCEDPAMLEVFALVRRVAAGRIPVLVTGETGSGKEVVSEALHRHSPRAAAPLVRLNCAALPEALLEAELFGYEKGAFTGAAQAKPGLFEAADGGTLLLDEIGDLPPGQQGKLLRVLEDGCVRRVGGLRDRRVDVRVVAATNRDLEAAIARGQFRADLFFRLSGVTITVPPLRERPRDVLALAHQFAGAATLSTAAEEALARYTWPGNVRELRNAIDRAILLAGTALLEPQHLPDRIRLGVGHAVPVPLPVLENTARIEIPPGGYAAVKDEMREVERARILEALEACAWNQTRTAARLGISRRTLVSRIASYGLTRPRR